MRSFIVVPFFVSRRMIRNVIFNHSRPDRELGGIATTLGFRLLGLLINENNVFTSVPSQKKRETSSARPYGLLRKFLRDIKICTYRRDSLSSKMRLVTQFRFPQDSNGTRLFAGLLSGQAKFIRDPVRWVASLLLLPGRLPGLLHSVFVPYFGASAFLPTYASSRCPSSYYAPTTSAPLRGQCPLR